MTDYLHHRGFNLISIAYRDLLPEIPADWKPEPQRVWQNDKENQDRSSLTAEKV